MTDLLSKREANQYADVVAPRVHDWWNNPDGNVSCCRFCRFAYPSGVASTVTRFLVVSGTVPVLR
jgi:hypothetical protein